MNWNKVLDISLLQAFELLHYVEIVIERRARNLLLHVQTSLYFFYLIEILNRMRSFSFRGRRWRRRGGGGIGERTFYKDRFHAGLELMFYCSYSQAYNIFIIRQQLEFKLLQALLFAIQTPHIFNYKAQAHIKW